jgi:DNA-binding transcriptional regulator GbsR (MarR family)
MSDFEQLTEADEHGRTPPSADRDFDALVHRRVFAACDAVGVFIEYWGFKAIHGRVWTLVALSRVPISQVDVAERLGVSRSLVSQAVAELEELGLVRPVGCSRKAPYVAVLDVWPTIADVLRRREWRMLEDAKQAFEAAAEEVELSPHAGYDLERIRLLLTMSEIAQAFVGVLIGLRVPANLERVNDWVGRARSLVGALRRFG